MTKQEHKQIEQLARDLKLIKSLQASDICTTDYQEAMALFLIGYRKADEVRKETAREILSVVDNERHNGQTISITYCLRKKYGLEVEE